MEPFISQPLTISGVDVEKPWVFCDLDDTLLGLLIDGKIELNERAYTKVLEDFCSWMTELFLGVSYDYAHELQYKIDSELCRQHGFEDPSRFATSLIEAFDVLCNKFTPTFYDWQAEGFRAELDAMGMGVFEHVFTPLPGALNTLEVLSKDYRVAIVTKGNPQIQEQKALDSGVIMYADALYAVSYKNMDDWRGIFFDSLRLSELDLRKSWAIGNSAKSDVNIPLSFGCNGIHLLTGGWKFEAAPLEPPLAGQVAVQVPSIGDVLKIVYPNTYMVMA